MDVGEGKETGNRVEVVEVTVMENYGSESG